MVMVKSSFKQEATKALYAVSALIRNNVDGQEMFYAESGDLMLQVTGWVSILSFKVYVSHFQLFVVL